MDTIIFDLDGTLLDTLEDLCLSVNYTLRMFKKTPRKNEEIRHFLGNGYRNLLAQAASADEKFLEDGIYETFKSHYEKHCQDHTKPYEGIIPMLKELKKRKYKLGIVSNKGNEAVQELHQKFFKDYIDVAIGESHEVSRKPAPDSVYATMKALNSIAANTIYMGDSEVDIKTAENAKISCICCTWGFRNKKELIKNHGKNFIDTPQEIFHALEQIKKNA